MDSSGSSSLRADPVMVVTGNAKIEKLTQRSVLIAGATLCLIHLSSLAFSPVDGHDASIHLFWMRAYSDLFGKISWWPSWSPLSNYGMGSPVFYFYPPLTYIIAAGVSHLFPLLSTQSLFKVVAAGAYLLAFLSMRLFLRSVGATKHGILAGSLLYTFNPYTYFTLFSRSSLTEHLAFAIIPLVFFAVQCIRIEQTRPLGFPLLSFGIAAVILTSIPSASSLLILLTLLVFFVLMVNRRRAAILLLGIILGCGAAALLLIPAWAFQSLLQTRNMWPGGDHSPLMEAWHSGYFQSRLLLPSLFLTLVVLWLLEVRDSLRSTRQDRNFVRRMLLGGMTLVLILQLPFFSSMMSPYLLPIRLIQYPWRTTTLAIFCASALIVLGRYRHIGSLRVLQIVLMGWVVSILIIEASTLMGFRLGTHQRGNMDSQSEFYSRYMSGPPDSIAQRIAGMRSEPAFMLSHASFAAITNPMEQPYDRSCTFNLPFPDTATVHLYYWPEWVATVNGRKVSTHPDSLGRTVLALPAGISTLNICLTDSSAEKIGRMITFASIFFIFLISLILFLQRRDPPNRSDQWPKTP